MLELWEEVVDDSESECWFIRGAEAYEGLGFGVSVTVDIVVDKRSVWCCKWNRG